MSIKKLRVIPKEGYLLLLDFDSDEEEQAHSEGIQSSVLIVSCSSLDLSQLTCNGRSLF